MKRVLFIASECVPFIKTGGLADVVGSLPKCFDKKYFDVRVILPKYMCMKEEFKSKLEYITHFYMDLGWRSQYVGVLGMNYDGIQYYFIDYEFYFAGPKPYGNIYEDIEKILNAGINVYTSTNLKRFQNVNSSFKEISGIGVKKTIPIRFLEMADRIVFVDRKPELLENDYKTGELFCNKNQNSRIMQKNFNPEILKKYRVISLEILKEYRNKIEIIENNDKNI